MSCIQEDDDGQQQELHDNDSEVFMLREQIRMLTTQFFTERQQWLEEKRRLKEGGKPLQASSSYTVDGLGRPCSQHAHQRVNSSVLLSSEAGSEAVCEDASQSSLSAREPCSESSCTPDHSTRSTSPNQIGSVAMPSSTASANVSSASTEILHKLANMQLQLEESRQQHESAAVRWALEREALQRQIHALISMSCEASAGFSATATQPHEGTEAVMEDTGGSTRGLLCKAAQEEDEERLQLSQRVSELEMLVAELQAERSNMEEQVRMLAADATEARRASRTMSESLISISPPPSRALMAEVLSAAPAASVSSGTGAWLSGMHAPTLRDNVDVAELLLEKTELERELLRYQAECVAVPRAEYADLSSLRSQMAYLQREVAQLREESEEAVRMRVAAEGELAAAFQDCVAVPHHEYQRLVRLEADSRARAVEAAESVPGAASPHPWAEAPQSAQADSLGEDRRLLAVVQGERDALADQVAALQLRVQAAEAEARRVGPEPVVKEREATAVAAVSSVRALDSACPLEDTGVTETPTATEVEEMRSELTALREQLATSVGASFAESGRLAARVSELQEEVELLRSQNRELAADLGAARQALASGKVQASDEALAAAAAVDKARIAAEGGLWAAQRRIAALEEALAEAQSAAAAAQADRNSFSVELVAVRDAALRTSQALADCLHSRYDETGLAAAAAAAVAVAESLGLSGSSAQMKVQGLEEQLAAARRAKAAVQSERDTALQELAAAREALASSEAARGAAQAASAETSRQLDATKLQLAEARELSLLFQSKRDVFQSKRVIRGLPQEWICGSAAAGSRSGSGGGVAEPPRQGSQREVVSVPVFTETDMEEEFGDD